MAYKKVWKKGTVDWGAAASNYAKRSAVERRRKKKAAEVASRKAARAAQTARNKAARESERRAKQRQREADKASRLAAAEAKKRERARIADEKQKQKLIALAKKEEAKREKKLKRLNGLFLEHDIPLKLFDVDLREFALDFDEENGISTVSGFKKVTIPHLEKSLFKLAIKLHINNTFDILYESELKQAAKSPKIAQHKKIVKFKSECKKYLVNTLPGNLNFDEFSSYADPVNAEAISEYIEANILPVVPAIQKEIAAIEKKEQEAKQKAKEIKELEDGCTKIMVNFDKTIANSVKLGKSMKAEINVMKSDLVALDESHNSAWFSRNKKKFALEAQGLAKVIWQKTPPLIEAIILIESSIKIIKNCIQNLDLNGAPIKEDDLLSKVNIALKESGYLEKTLDRFKKLYLAKFKNLEMRLSNLEKAISYYEDDRELKAIEKIKNEGIKLSKDSKNISNLFSKFGG